MRSRVLAQVTLLTFREFVRTPGAVFWTYGFPLLMALSLGFAFRATAPAPLSVAVVADQFTADELRAVTKASGLAVEQVTAAAATAGYRRGRYLLVASRERAGGPLRIVLDPGRPDAELAHLRVERALVRPLRDGDPQAAEVVHETTPGWRYIDWLIPGLIGLNLLGAGLWGVGFNLVQMRVKNILRRLMVTPMHRSEFLLAFLLSRLVLVIPEAAVILLFGRFVFDVPIVGSVATIVLLVMVGAVAFTGLGMLVASRARTIETVSGMMNLIMLPMWLLGGCFFSNERFPDAVQPLVKILPLTHFNDAIRAVMTEGAGVLDVWPQLAFLAGFSVVAMGLAIRCFRWT